MTNKKLKCALDLFEKEFWKDYRKMEICTDNDTIVKHYTDFFEQRIEISVLDYLKNNGIMVPNIVQYEELSTRMSYHKGIRVFNLLVNIDEFAQIDSLTSKKLKKKIMDKCIYEQKQIQRLLNEWNKEFKAVTEAYPIEKLTTVIDILSQCLDLKYDHNKIIEEQKKFNEYWINNVSVPFRDSTTKNMIIEAPELALNNFESEEQRKKYIMEMIQKGDMDRVINSPIVNIDFSSCVNLTTEEDDLIGLCFHERTWNNTLDVLETVTNAYRTSMTFIMRFLRFGGRKAAYELLHKDAFKIRFKYDDSRFYFQKLPFFASKYTENICDEYNEIFNFIQCVNERLEDIRVTNDFFVNDGRAKEERTYLDIFPF